MRRPQQNKAARTFPANSRIFEPAQEIKVFWFFSSEKNNILNYPARWRRKRKFDFLCWDRHNLEVIRTLLFLKKKKQKDFYSCVASTIRGQHAMNDWGDRDGPPKFPSPYQHRGIR
jgi:hypothetical protein